MNTNYGSSTWNHGMGPLGELRREVDRFFNDYWSAPATRDAGPMDSEWNPACDVEEAKDHFLLTIDTPGIAKDQIKIETVDNEIHVSGERRAEEKADSKGARYSERRFGKFHRRFTLPVGVRTDQIEASYQDGMLRIYVPKVETAKPRQIKISTGTGSGFFSKLIGQSESNTDRVA